jgi:hypothetical protein
MAIWIGLGDNTELFWAVLSQREEAIVIQLQKCQVCATQKLFDEMPHLNMILGAKSSCYGSSGSIYRQLWIYGELLNKFMDLEMHFQSWWT